MASTKYNKTIGQLQDENIELKLTDIRKDIQNVNMDIDLKLTVISSILKEVLEHAKKTNGSVAKVMQRVDVLENKTSCLEENLNQVKPATEVVGWLITHPKIFKYIVGIIILLAAVGGGENIINVFKSLFNI